MKDSRLMQTVAYDKDRIEPNEKGHQDKMALSSLSWEDPPQYRFLS